MGPIELSRSFQRKKFSILLAIIISSLVISFLGAGDQIIWSYVADSKCNECLEQEYIIHDFMVYVQVLLEIGVDKSDGLPSRFQDLLESWYQAFDLFVCWSRELIFKDLICDQGLYSLV